MDILTPESCANMAHGSGAMCRWHMNHVPWIRSHCSTVQDKLYYSAGLLHKHFEKVLVVKLVYFKSHILSNIKIDRQNPASLGRCEFQIKYSLSISRSHIL